MTTGNVLKDPGTKAKKVPIVIETIHSTADLAEKESKRPVYEKRLITGNLPVAEGYVRCIVLIDHKGMLDDLYVNDVVDMPERRFKTESNRGIVKEYKGDRIPNKQR